jgi:hypothetical protein
VSIAERPALVVAYLKEYADLSAAGDFFGLTQLNNIVEPFLYDFSTLKKQTIFYDVNRMSVDSASMDLLNSVHSALSEVPVCVPEDGHCLLNAASLGASGNLDLVLDIKLTALYTLVKESDAIQREAQYRGWNHMVDSYMDEINKCATMYEWSSMYTVSAISRGCNFNIKLVYPPENGLLDGNIQICGGQFPPPSERQRKSNADITVSSTVSISPN